MKKLMIAATVAVLGIAANAASWDWSVSTGEIKDGYQGASGNVAGANAYLMYYNADIDGDGTEVGLSQASLLTLLQAGGTMADTGIAEYVMTDGLTVGGNGKINSSFSTDDTKFALDGDSQLGAYLVVLSSDGKNAFISAEDVYAGDALSGGEIDIAVGKSDTFRDATGKAAYGNAGWYAVGAVPEPTSGLLLLLGVAGLALRRRRA